MWPSIWVVNLRTRSGTVTRQSFQPDQNPYKKRVRMLRIPSGSANLNTACARTYTYCDHRYYTSTMKAKKAWSSTWSFLRENAVYEGHYGSTPSGKFERGLRIQWFGGRVFLTVPLTIRLPSPLQQPLSTLTPLAPIQAPKRWHMAAPTENPIFAHLVQR